MSATSAVLRGRMAAQALMLDTCTITRLSGQSTDKETGIVTGTSTTMYTGQCKVQESPRAAVARPEQVGQAQVYISRLELHLPMTATGIAADDTVTITASALDPDLVGRMFRVRELAHKTFLTARRLGLIEVTS